MSFAKNYEKVYSICRSRKGRHFFMKKPSNRKLKKLQKNYFKRALRDICFRIHDYLTLHPEIRETEKGQLLHNLTVYVHMKAADHDVYGMQACILDVMSYRHIEEKEDIEKYKGLVDALLEQDLSLFEEFLNVSKEIKEKTPRHLKKFKLSEKL